MIHKKNKNTANPSSYRPISMLPIFSIHQLHRITDYIAMTREYKLNRNISRLCSSV